MEFTFRVTCDADQPQWFVESAAAGGVRSTLDGWTENVRVQLVREAAKEDN